MAFSSSSTNVIEVDRYLLPGTSDLYESELAYADTTFREYYPVNFGEIIKDRYKLLNVVKDGCFADGTKDGCFARVARAFDYQNKRYVALKIAKKSARCTYLARNAITMMQMVDEKVEDPTKKELFVTFVDYFMWKDFLFISTEYYCIGTLQDFVSCVNGLQFTDLCCIGYQLFNALKILGRPELNIIHGNLKSSNIMMSDSLNATYVWNVRICDFEFAQNANRRHFSVVGKPQYRAPEVSLKVDYDRSIDVWSVGCVLAEAVLCGVLFEENTYENPFRSIVKFFGIPPSEMLEESPVAERYFIKSIDGKYRLKNSENLLSLGLLEALFERSGNLTYGFHRDKIKEFLDLLYRIFVYDPRSRLSVEDALNHKFIERIHDLYTLF